MSHFLYSLFGVWCILRGAVKGFERQEYAKLYANKDLSTIFKKCSFFQSSHPLSFFLDRLLALLSLMMMMMMMMMTMMMVVSQEGTLHHFQYKDGNLLTLWAFFSIASCRSFLSLSSRSLLSFRLSLTRRDLIVLMRIYFCCCCWLSFCFLCQLCSCWCIPFFWWCCC